MNFGVLRESKNPEVRVGELHYRLTALIIFLMFCSIKTFFTSLLYYQIKMFSWTDAHEWDLIFFPFNLKYSGTPISSVEQTHSEVLLWLVLLSVALMKCSCFCGGWRSMSGQDTAGCRWAPYTWNTQGLGWPLVQLRSQTGGIPLRKGVKFLCAFAVTHSERAVQLLETGLWFR